MLLQFIMDVVIRPKLHSFSLTQNLEHAVFPLIYTTFLMIFTLHFSAIYDIAVHVTFEIDVIFFSKFVS